MTAHPKTNIVPVACTNVSQGGLERQQRDLEICRLPGSRTTLINDVTGA